MRFLRRQILLDAAVSGKKIKAVAIVEWPVPQSDVPGGKTVDSERDIL